MPITIDELSEAVATGVLRAMEARQLGQKAAQVDVASLVRSGFYVDIHIRAGGRPTNYSTSQFALNPQPEPPGREL